MSTQLANLDNDNVILFTEILQRLKNSLTILPDKPEETPETTLHALWHAISDNPLSVFAASKTPLSPLNVEDREHLVSLVEKRIQGTPLAHISGRHHFMGMEVLCNGDALIPRKDTELLAEVCLRYLAEVNTCGTPRALDLFTGSGILPLCFKDRVSGASVYGSDLSRKAIALARENAEHLGLSVKFLVSDMFDAFSSDNFTSYFDLISGAPPYIASVNVEKMADEIAHHEPSMAFDAGPFGIKFFIEMIKESPRLLKPHGKLIFEVGQGQGEGIAKRLKKNSNYDDIELIRDDKGDVRVLEARIVK